VDTRVDTQLPTMSAVAQPTSSITGTCVRKASSADIGDSKHSLFVHETGVELQF